MNILKTLILTLTLALGLSTPLHAADSLDVSNLGIATNATVTSTANTATALPLNKDITLQPKFTAAAGGTSNVVVGLNLQMGSTWTTTYPLLITNSANGTNPVVGWNVISKTNLVGATAIRADELITTQTNGVTLNALQLDYVH